MAKVIGLTGGIATGKSLVSSYLKERGYFIIDADLIARQIVEPGSIGLEQIRDRFGEEFIQQDGILNRKKLGEVIFNDDDKRQLLNNITHPLIEQEVLKLLKEQRGQEMIFLDVPLLIEAGFDRMVDEVWLIVASREQQIQRIQQRDNLSMEQAIARIDSQMSTEEKIRRADVVIDNSTTKEKAIQQVEQQLQRGNSSCS